MLVCINNVMTSFCLYMSIAPYEHHSSKAKTGLTEAKNLLCSHASSKTTVSMDAQLLLAKLHFACGKEYLLDE